MLSKNHLMVITSSTVCIPASIMIKEEKASPPTKCVRYNDSISVTQKVGPTCSNVTTLMTLVDKQMITDGLKLHDKHIQFEQCISSLVLEVFILPYCKKGTMNSQEIAFKKTRQQWWYQICTQYSKAI